MDKSLQKNDNAVSPVIGAILMLAIGVTILTSVQLNFIPVWNTQEELDHIQKMFNDFKELKSGIDSTVQSGTPASLPIIMGFKYSPKFLVYNPKESAFVSLEIKENTWAEVRYNEMFSDGMTDETSIKNVTTSTITYALKGSQVYNSSIYEHGIIRRSGSNYTASSQVAITNGIIYLLSVKPLGQDTSTGVGMRTINIYPTSQQKNSVLGKNVWIILHTKPEYVNWWSETIEKERPGAVKLANSTSGIVISNIETMVIKMGEAYISTTPRVAPPHAAQYRVVKITPDNTYLPVDGITTLVVEVQDRYNNPVPNVPVNFSKNYSRKPANSNDNAQLLQNSAISGTDGRASVGLKTSGAGFYYIDAHASRNLTTFAFPASSQGYSLSLSYAGSGPNYTVNATLKDGLGTLMDNTVDFGSGDGYLYSNSVPTVSGIATTVLNSSKNASNLTITGIKADLITSTTASITWDVVNYITVTAKTGNVFNYNIISTKVNSSGCVHYGTVPGNYIYEKCSSIFNSSHNVFLTDLSPGTAYYFIVNSSRPDELNINSTEYMFVTLPGVPSVVNTTPASVTNLTNATYEPMQINWTWTDPADLDFDHVEVYIDGLPFGTVAKGIQSFNSSYFKPNSSHTISTHAWDTSGNVNATWVNWTASTPSLFTYVFDFLMKTNGTVTDEVNAKNASDCDLSAILSKRLEGGTNKSNQTKNPSKVITAGVQSGGSYIPGYVNVSDGLIDRTNTSEKQIKTVVYYMGERESTGDLAANTNYTGPPVAVYLPEQDVVVRTAWLELRQLSATSAASVTTINMYLNGRDYSAISGGTYQANTGESLITVARANVTQAFTGFTNPSTFTAAVKTGGVTSNAQALLLYVTYEYNPNSPRQLRTVRYPLDTKTGQIAGGTSTNFIYNVSIPEAATIRSSWFEIRGKLDSVSSTDALIRARIAPNTTYSAGVSLDRGMINNYEFIYLFKTTSEFQLNSAQTLVVRNQNQIVYTMGGEVIVTYEYSNDEPVQLKTVKYFVGQQTAKGGTVLVSSSSTIFIPEQNISIKSVWARIRATYTSTTSGTHTLGGRISGTAIANNAYTVDTNNALIGDYMIIYNMTSAASALLNNTIVLVNNTFSQTNHGPTGIELLISYTYDPTSPAEIKTVEYPAGQSALQAATRNENFYTFVPENQTLRRGAYIDYVTMSSSAGDYTTTSAIDTSFSSQTVNIDGTGEALAAGVMNNDPQNRITASNNIYSINYSSNAAASFSGVAMLTYEFTKNNSVNATYTFIETNSSARWQSISIKDSSYGDALANARIFNNFSGQWEPLSLITLFDGGSTPAQHVNATVGKSGNASDYDAGSGSIKIRYNWTGSIYYNSLGIDLINVTVNYVSGGSFRLNVTSNTTDVPENTSSQELQIRYSVSGDNFTLQLWNSSSSTWNNRSTLNQTSFSYKNITLLPEELIQNGNFSGSPLSIRKYYVTVRYLGENPGVEGKLYLDYQRVKSS